MFKVDTTTLVERILASYPRARQDDKYLMLKVWHEEGLPLTVDFVNTFLSHDVTSPETIRRTRQKIQAEGRYQAPEPVREARQELERETRVEMIQTRLI